MFVLAHINGCQVLQGQIFVTIHVCTDDGREFSADVPFPAPAESVQQMNNRVEDRVRRALTEQGVVLATGDTIRLIGGVA